MSLYLTVNSDYDGDDVSGCM